MAMAMATGTGARRRRLLSLLRAGTWRQEGRSWAGGRCFHSSPPWMFSSVAAVAARRERALPEGRLGEVQERPLPTGRERALLQAQERSLLEGREQPLPKGRLAGGGERPLLKGRDCALPEGRLPGEGECPLLEGCPAEGGGGEHPDAALFIATSVMLRG